MSDEGLVLDYKVLAANLCRFALFTDPVRDDECNDLTVTLMDLRGSQPLSDQSRVKWKSKSDVKGLF